MQNIIDDVPFDNLPVKWQEFDFTQFSKDKTLFDFRQDTLRNALKDLYLYLKDKQEDKNGLYLQYRDNGLEENFDYNLNRETNKIK